MFEVTGKEVMALDEEVLRELVRRLCEAEVERDGGAALGVYCSGDQNAGDGGVDVAVNIDFSLRAGSYIPSSHTYYQIKKPKMLPSAIRSEMCPKGKLRPIFAELASVKGSYILVSGTDNVSPSEFNNRMKEMKTVLGDLSENIGVDFYDQNRLAQWANNYEPVIAWINDKLGKPSKGWRPYGSWTKADNDKVMPYIVDKEARVKKPYELENITIEKAQKEIRSLLQVPGNSVRLIGLSGVGKTRFVQALFEESAGGEPLPKGEGLYVDFQHMPQISPADMLNHLIAEQHRKIVIVDNCSASEHRLLTEICKSEKSVVSLITVEYDVQDDKPEDSEVYQIFPSSNECIIRILEQQNLNRNREDVMRIAMLSGGNARIAIVLAKAAAREKDLNALNDRELFNRIFWQKGQINEGLRMAAEVCSLVYSFSIENSVSDERGMGTAEEEFDELNVLAKICGMSRKELYRNVNELFKRQLVQKRSFWRAVLPHALANRLAKDGLADFEISDILEGINHSSEHMQRSFSKRLSYLHDSREARDIFSRWLESPPMTVPKRWDYVCQYRLEDAVPIIPDKVLLYLENMLEKQGGAYVLEAFAEQMLVEALLYLAYEEKRFERSIKILAGLPLSHDKVQMAGRLFQVMYSGTKALQRKRLELIRWLLHDKKGDNAWERYRILGLNGLEHMLRCRGQIFARDHGRTFGIQQRDDGFMPTNRQEYSDWFLTVFAFVEKEMSGLPFSVQVQIKEILGNGLQGFWREGNLELMEECCQRFGGEGDWWQGWIALGKIKRFAGEKRSGEQRAALDKLIALTEPKDAVSRMVCILQTCTFDLEVYFPSEDRLKEECKKLADEFVRQPEQLAQLFSGIHKDYWNMGEFFGEYLAEADADFAQTNDSSSHCEWLWVEICKSLNRNLSIAVGYLRKKYERNKAQTLALLEDLEKTEFASQAVRLRIGLDSSAEYLQHVLELLTEEVIDFNCISYLRFFIADGKIGEKELLTFLLKLAEIKGGVSAALDIFESYCKQTERKRELLSECAKEVGRFLITEKIKECRLNKEVNLEYQMTELIDCCFSGENIPKEQIDKLFNEWKEYLVIWGINNDSLTNQLILSAAKLYAEEFLDIVVDERENDNGVDRDIAGNYGMSVNIIDHLAPDRVCAWANTSVRRLRVAKLCSGFYRSKEQGYQWTELARQLLATEDGKEIVTIFAEKMVPVMWSSGSRSRIVKERLKLLRDLTSDIDLGKTTKLEIKKLEEEIVEMEDTERRMMLSRERMNERFEF